MAIIFLCTISAWPQDIDESAMFDDTATVTQTPLNNSEAITNADEQKAVGFSGEVTSAGMVSFPRDSWDTPRLSAYMVANLLLDARLPGGAKSFLNTEARYTPASDSAEFYIRELFIDANLNNLAYFRAGKQVLQWGRCYFWNPTDLINVERVSFIKKIGYREGAYGLKMHVPYGTRANLYGFWDVRNADSLLESSGSIKFEVVASGTEMAIAAWNKKGKKPVLGLDFSSRLLTIDISGEMSVFRRDNEMVMRENNGVLSLEKGPKEWAPRAALGLSHAFDFNGIPDRIMVVAEGYYNGAGNNSRIFEDTTHYRWQGDEQSIAAVSPIPLPDSLTNSLPPIVLQGVTKLEYFLMNNLYRPNEHAYWYASLFTSFGRFITSSMTLSANAICNIEESSFVISEALTYTTLNNFSLGVTLIQNLGPDKTEYTYFSDPLMVQVTAGIVF